MRPIDTLNMPAKQLIHQWCVLHRSKSAISYADLIAFLMTDYKGQILEPGDDFMSGADFIDYVLDDANEIGLWRLLQAIQTRDYGITPKDYDLIGSVDAACQNTSVAAWRAAGKKLLRDILRAFDIQHSNTCEFEHAGVMITVLQPKQDCKPRFMFSHKDYQEFVEVSELSDITTPLARCMIWFSLWHQHE